MCPDPKKNMRRIAAGNRCMAAGVWGDIEGTSVVEFGKALSGVEWKAGQLRTYTLTVDAVKVHIADAIASGVKNNVVITNTGNTKAFIRATIIGNWCAADGEAVFGYTDFVDNPGQYVEIDSWTVENTQGGTFVDLPGDDWVRATDGYYYYTTAVEPTHSTGSALFTSYTPGTAPNYQIAGQTLSTHFVMEISTQAVSARPLNANAEDYTWQQAWAAALGTAPTVN